MFRIIIILVSVLAINVTESVGLVALHYQLWCMVYIPIQIERCIIIATQWGLPRNIYTIMQSLVSEKTPQKQSGKHRIEVRTR